ncbi:PAS domain S-box protein [Thermoleptolyngbya sp. C42_A2020_037]|uniref:PAS domain S-box protein n=1 Tax=Thermoleptolyngbya sp. C42_A2020_037 TaxID=2747799 RepID=UPI0019E4609E|nr:PAS domain S-box protein [Thermoleptolyngbya sp. C42_A2020_037]MBF2084073.1 PAS domain S-box protein [Thermoleptolyngbya sp. C42_A2020_037]
MPPQPSDDVPSVDRLDNEANCDRESLSHRRQLPLFPISQPGALRLGDRPAPDTDPAALPYLRAFFEEAMDAMAIADDSGYYIDANPAACELFGVSLDDLLGRCIADFSQVEFDFPSAWQQFLEKGHERGEFILVRPDGTVREVEYAATAHFVPHRHLSVLRDMTERRQLERRVQALNHDLEQQVQQRTADLLATNARLQAANQQLQAEIRQRERAEIALECAEDGVWDWHIPTRTLWLSGEWKRMLGYDEETDEIGDRLREWSSRLHPDDRNRVLWETEIHLAGRTPLFRSEYRLRARDGTWRWILDRGKVVERDATGAPLRMIGTHVDITERKRLEESLRESQQKYRTLFEILPVGVSITDAAGRVIEANPAFEQILGLSAEKYTQYVCDASTWEMLRRDGSPMPPAECAAVRALWEGQAIVGQEQGIRRSDGSVSWMSVSAAPIPLKNYGVAIAHVDISDRKAAEIALRQSELRFQEISNSSPANIYILVRRRDGSWYVEHMSRAIEEILEYSVAQVIENPDLLVECIHADDRAAYEAAVEQSLASLEPFYCEWRVVTPSGSVKWLKGSSRPRQRDNGEIAWYGVVLDISNLKAAEAGLRQREQEFRTLAENAPDGIMRCDRQFRFLYVNPTVENLTGVPADRFIGLTSQDLGFPEALVNLWHEAMEKTFTTGQEQVVEYDMPLPSGGLSFNSRIVPELTDEGVVASVLIVARDITTLRQAQNALAAQAERERALRLITQHIRETLNLEQILETAVQEVQRALQADRTLVLCLDGDRRGVVIQEAVQPEYPPMLNRMLNLRRDGDSFFGDWNPADAPADAPDNAPADTPNDAQRAKETALGDWREVTEPIAVQSNLVAPIAKTLEDGSIVTWGLLMTHACAQPRVWKPEEADLLQQVANQLAIAIQQSSLHQQIQRWAATLEQQVRERTAELRQALEFEAALKRITDKVRDSLDERKILQAVVQELGQTLRVLCCDTALYDLEHRTSTIYCEYAATEQSAEGMVLSMNDHPDIYAQLLQGISQQFCFRRLEARASRHLMYSSTIFTQPIWDDQGSLGDIWLLRPREQWFSEPEIRLVQQVANQCAIALRQSRLYQAAQAQVTELERLNRLKDDFLSTVSHELRTPMANITLATDLLEIHLQRAGLLPAPNQHTPVPIAQYFQILKDESQREISLINDLLDLARIDAEAEPLVFSTLTLQDWLPHVLEPFLDWAQHQQQRLTLSLAPDFPPITTDRTLLQRVLRELLNNACKYTPPGEAIEVSAAARETHLHLCVANTGVNLPATECNCIFDRFYRIPNLDPWKHGGTGLGLTLVKKRVEYLGGVIWAECEPQRLSLKIQLPLERSPLP